MGNVVSIRKAKPAKLSLMAAVENLSAYQSHRRFAIVCQSRCDRSVESFLARALGYDVDAEEVDRKAKFKEAGNLRRAIEKGQMDKVPAKFKTGAIPLIVRNSAASRKVWDDYRKEVEEGMREVAQMLPIYEFAKSVKGFGDLGLGIIIAETGNLTHYSGPAKVWKRLGLAVIHGERQQRKTDPELALEHGFSPKRRAEIWALCSDSMFKHQWIGADSAYRKAIEAHSKALAYCVRHGVDLKKIKGEELTLIAGKFDIVASAGPAGPYGEIYARRRLNTQARRDAALADDPETKTWAPGHQHKDATRIMTKAFLCDLWRVWHGQEPRYAKIEDDRSQVEAA